MLEFVVGLPAREVEEVVRREQVNWPRPPGSFTREFEEDTRLGGRVRGKYWMEAEGKGERFPWKRYRRYFIYRLIPEGACTRVRGKFVPGLWDRLWPCAALALILAFLSRHPSEILDGRALAVLFLFLGAGFSVMLAHQYWCYSLPPNKRYEEIVIAYFAQLEARFPPSGQL